MDPSASRDTSRKRAGENDSPATSDHESRQANKKMKHSTAEEPGTKARPIDLTLDDDDLAGPDTPHSMQNLFVTGSQQIAPNPSTNEHKEEQKPADSAYVLYPVFPALPAPSSAASTPYIIPEHIQRHLAPTDASAARAERYPDQLNNLNYRRHLWRETTNHVAGRMTRERWEGDYFEETDLTPHQLYRSVRGVEQNGTNVSETDEEEEGPESGD